MKNLKYIYILKINSAIDTLILWSIRKKIFLKQWIPTISSAAKPRVNHKKNWGFQKKCEFFAQVKGFSEDRF